ncbi:MAG: hypothetical protein ACK4I8_07100 [Armatimonadota bacterium]
MAKRPLGASPDTAEIDEDQRQRCPLRATAVTVGKSPAATEFCKNS